MEGWNKRVDERVMQQYGAGQGGDDASPREGGIKEIGERLMQQ